MVHIFKKLSFCALCLIAGRSEAQPEYYTIVSYPVGQILAAPSNSVLLPDGSTITVQRLGLGNSNPGNLRGDFGAYNTNQLGGIFNGVVNVNDNSGNASTQGITLSSYPGNRVAGSFTRISANTGNVDRNGANPPYLYRNGIGLYIHTTKPQRYQNFLMIDCGGDDGSSDNQEWLSSIGYTKQSNNTYTTVQPGYVLATNTLLSQFTNQAVNASWENAVQSSLNNTGITLNNANIVRKTSGQGSLDPDDTVVQAAISYGSNLLTDVFFFWGIWGNAANGGQQSSGLSPLVFGYNFDFGDAPASYNTMLSDTGARHLWTDNSQIYLGSSVTREPDGNVSTTNATAHTDDDGRLDGSIIFSMGQNVLQKTYPQFTYPVTYTNNTGKPGYIAAWIDWNGDGRFSADEGITGITPAASTRDTFRFAWTNKTVQRKDITTQQTFIRIRYSTDTITTADFLGVKGDGEVEDYVIQIVLGALPVDIRSFDVKEQKNGLVCNWTVTNQQHIDHYSIESSTNGKVFTTAAGVIANDRPEYDYTYTLQSTGKAVYYRLAIHDRNGEISYSNTRFLPGHTEEQLNIHPNPARDKVNITLNRETQQAACLYNVMGRLIRTVDLQPGLNAIDISTWANGVYFIMLNGAQTIPVYSRFEIVN